MQIAFDTRYLREVCESGLEAERAFGPEVSQILKHRLADLRAARTVMELRQVSAHVFRFLEEGRFALSLRNGYEIALEVNHPRIPTSIDGQVDWRRVTRVRVVAIGVEPCQA